MSDINSKCPLVALIGACFKEPLPPYSASFPVMILHFTYVVGRGGALVKSMTLNRRVVLSTPALAATYTGTLGIWTSPLLTIACALRRETPIQYPCCSRESLWV